ncbi:MAG: hypothetical protein LLG16_08030, partial [Euryarchaeota archaeon]|nr:hypothetical protein [Euryarchaeota archaeon]
LKRKVLGCAAIGLLLITFVPIPIATVLPDYSYDVDLLGTNDVTVAAGSSVTFSIMIKNTGNTNYTVEMQVMDLPMSWNGGIYLHDTGPANSTDHLKFDLAYKTSATVDMTFNLAVDEEPGAHYLIVEIVSMDSSGDEQEPMSQTFLVNVA